MPDVRTRVVTRDTLRRALGNHEMIRAFEALVEDVGTTLPGAVDDVASVAEAASTDASVASASAAAAQWLVGVVADAVAADPTTSALRAEVAELRAQVQALQQGVTP